MRTTEISLYEVLKISSSASEEEVLTAIQTERRQWQGKCNSANLERRQQAERAMSLISEAEAILLDPVKRADYDSHKGDSAAAEEPRFIIWSDYGTQSITIDLIRIIKKNETSSGPFTPSIDKRKAPVMTEGEIYHQVVAGWAQCGHAAWEGAPFREISALPGNTSFYFTSHGITFICPNVVAPKSTDFDATGNSGWALAGALSLAASRNAAASAKNKDIAFGGRIPWEFVAMIEVEPSIEAVLFRFNIVAGESRYQLTLLIPGGDHIWARTFAEWLTKIAMSRRLETFGDLMFPSELLLVQEKLEHGCSKEITQNGSLTYYLPFTFDAGHAIQGSDS